MVSRHPTRTPGRPACRPIRVAAASLLSLVVALLAQTISAQPPPTPGPPLSAEGLTQGLVALNVTYQLAPAAKRAQLLSDLLAVAATRQQLLAGLIESDPAEVLRITIPAHLRASLPLAVQASVEEEIEVEGELEILHEDRTDGSRYLYFLEAVASRLSLHFAADPPTHLQTGDRVRVRGVQVNQALALESGSSSVQSLPRAGPAEHLRGAENPRDPGQLPGQGHPALHTRQRSERAHHDEQLRLGDLLRPDLVNRRG